jgi:hypothetical protein
MPNIRKVLYMLLLAGLAFAGFSGCVPAQPYSSIPQSRPAEWEGRIPGMGR